MSEKRIYLAGPMTGKPQLNFPAFMNAARQLRAEGYSVFNPAEKDLENGITAASQPSYSLAWFMAIDLPEVCRADLVMALPGWEQSAGACIELNLAMALKIPVFDYTSRQKIQNSAIMTAYAAKHWGFET